MAVTGTHFDLKILVDKEKGKVLFAEADGDFVDVLFSFLTLPIGTIVRLIAKTQPEQAPTLGCFATLCHSVKNLGDEYFWDEAFKDMLLHPRSSSEVICRYLKVNIDDTEANCFLCPNHQKDYCIGYMSFYQNSWCPGCGKSMNVHRVIPLDDSSKGKVFVTKASKFIITDDLQVIPIVPGTVIDFLNNLGFNDMSAIEGRTAKLGMDEVIELLKWTLLSTTPLTDLFVSKNRLHVINPLPQTPTLHMGDGIDRSVEEDQR